MANDLLYNHEASIHETRGLNNSSPFKFDRNMTRDPENIITIFTVNTLPLYSTSGKKKFAGRPKDKRFLKVGSLCDPTYCTDALAVDGQSNKNIVIPDDGEWVAMDWLNPENVFKLDQDYVVPGLPDYSTDLLQRGVFYIKRRYNNVTGNIDDQPTEQELVAAENRLKTRRTALVRLYNQTSTSSPAKLSGIMSEEMIDALNFAGIQTPYNSALQEKVQCVNCGEMKLATAKFHKSDNMGVICIEPSTEGWRAAVNAGIKARADVPEEFQWDGRRKI
jgi:hypothetical protein